MKKEPGKVLPLTEAYRCPHEPYQHVPAGENIIKLLKQSTTYANGG